ncbi:MAG: hypothetical protein LBK99_00855, partial [Opitutaceae bacterium]|nr:hypothetical protein [Opitutaceae bacterium]
MSNFSRIPARLAKRIHEPGTQRSGKGAAERVRVRVRVCVCVCVGGGGGEGGGRVEMVDFNGLKTVCIVA